MSNEKKLTYKDRPLVRCGRTVYYGSLMDDYVVMMQILKSEKLNDVDISQKIHFQLISTDETLPLQERVKKSSEKDSFFDAIEIATIWLDRANKE